MMDGSSFICYANLQYLTPRGAQILGSSVLRCNWRYGCGVMCQSIYRKALRNHNLFVDIQEMSSQAVADELQHCQCDGKPLEPMESLVAGIMVCFVSYKRCTSSFANASMLLRPSSSNPQEIRPPPEIPRGSDERCSSDEMLGLQQPSAKADFEKSSPTRDPEATQSSETLRDSQCFQHASGEDEVRTCQAAAQSTFEAAKDSSSTPGTSCDEVAQAEVSESSDSRRSVAQGASAVCAIDHESGGRSEPTTVDNRASVAGSQREQRKGGNTVCVMGNELSPHHAASHEKPPSQDLPRCQEPPLALDMNGHSNPSNTEQSAASEIPTVPHYELTKASIDLVKVVIHLPEVEQSQGMTVELADRTLEVGVDGPPKYHLILEIPADVTIVSHRMAQVKFSRRSHTLTVLIPTEAPPGNAKT